MLVASIIAKQVVCTSTVALGPRKFAEEKATITQLQSIETLSCMNILCSNKTGMLTRNKMELQDDLPIFDPTATREEYTVMDHLPFDVSVKRTESTIRGPDVTYSRAKVLDLAKRGIRSLAVARTSDEEAEYGNLKPGTEVTIGDILLNKVL
ncbi:plasma-membrane proton-efflux P-type ATPase [Phytophthora cinnamomi]|uniref:plasma-membrane proton-efflux P-type ATPase n=1 Tax=Phytophthora cinnamomi TaxID=4785 RepID=UPI00355AB15C|nr:plasma-membrane proton-efflux P-type ATPase [Phytophthora cinnamomi]KAG6609017.1 plasma-membrane proton-efflux P-type ATPase [Phytophthora cinnamomi]